MSTSVRTCLITGATNGIGRAAATTLASMGYSLLVHGRSAKRVDDVVEAIRSAGGVAAPLIADMGSLSEVRRLASEVLELAPRLDALVLNAAIWPDTRVESAEGYELTFQVNYLSHYLLTQLLLPRLIESAPARIVVTSSVAYQGGQIDFDDLHLSQQFRGDQAYANSKLAQMLFCAGLAKRLVGTGVTANSLCPGLVDTGLIAHNRDFDAVRGRLRARMRPAQEGAELTIKLVSAPELAAVSGSFFSRSQTGTQATPIRAPESVSERLWQVSAELVGLSAGAGRYAT